jgi:hypothetical protein
VIVVCGILITYLPLQESLRTAKSTSDITPYVIETGGRIEVIKSFDPAEISKSFLKTIDAFRDYYRIEYYSTDTKHDGKHRKIRIKLSADAQKSVGKARVLSKQGYYARNDSGIEKPK